MLEKFDFKGCGNCPLSELKPRGACIKNHRVHLKVKITKDIQWEGWNTFYPVFDAGDVVDVKGVAKDGILYCCSGESTLEPGVKDYIDLSAIEIVSVYKSKPKEEKGKWFERYREYEIYISPDETHYFTETRKGVIFSDTSLLNLKTRLDLRGADDGKKEG